MSLVRQKLLDHIQRQLGIELSGHSVIGHGAHNQNYLLETGRGKLILRVYANIQFKNAAKEYDVLNTIDGFLGPRAFYLDTSKVLIEYDYMVLEYIEGTVLTEFDDPALKEIAGSLKKLHGIKGTERGPVSPVSDWTRNNITVNSARLGEELHRDVMALWERLMALHSQIEPHLAGYDSNSLIHDDPILGNLIQTGDCIKFIDWELAHYNYFFIELGGFIEENGLTRQQETIFLEAYGFGSTPVESKIMAFSKAYRVAAIVGWYIERIASLRDGVEVFIAADQAEYEKNLVSEMKHLERLL